MAIVKSENKIKFIKAKLAAYNDINVTYPHCIFFATDDKSIMVDNVKYGLGTAEQTELLKKIVADIILTDNKTISLVDASDPVNTVGTSITIQDASSTQSGLMSAADKVKFDTFFGETGGGVNLQAIWDMIGTKGDDSAVEATTLWGGINEVQNELNTFKAEKGKNGGLAPLDETGLIPSKHLPSYVDDVVEVATESALPETGESGKIYITADTNLIFRWVDETKKYVEIPKTSAEAINRLNTIQTKDGIVDQTYSIAAGVTEAKTYTDDCLSWYEDDAQS